MNGAPIHIRRDSPAVFSILSNLVEERTGLHYALAERELFLDRIASRATEAGFESLLDYYYFLRYDPGASIEMRALTEKLVTKETFFFREIEPLRVIIDRFLKPAVAAGQRPRVWSAACATGEEPLTFAMLLAAEGLLGAVDIVASDISDDALARARTGRFSGYAVRDGFDRTLRARWLKGAAGGEWVVDQQLIDAIEWRCVNLADQAQVAEHGAAAPYDVILCHNVLIYFGDDTVLRVLRSLCDAMAPLGVLLVGTSESLLRFGTFLSCQEHSRVFFYRKAA